MWAKPVIALSCVILAVTALLWFRTERSSRPVPVAEAQLPKDQAELSVAGYQETAFALSDGQELFRAFNCIGCHQSGGGGIGPALMDASWRYGSSPGEIYRTIVEGRPNGMPSFRGKIPDEQIWHLVVYVRSLSNLVPAPIRSSRDDHMQKTPPSTLQEPALPAASSGPTTSGQPQ